MTDKERFNEIEDIVVSSEACHCTTRRWNSSLGIFVATLKADGSRAFDIIYSQQPNRVVLRFTDRINQRNRKISLRHGQTVSEWTDKINAVFYEYHDLRG